MATKREKKAKAERRAKRFELKEENKGIDITMNILQVIPAYILATEYGWGNRRLEKFMMRLGDLTNQHKLRRDVIFKMKDILYEDKGMFVDFGKNYIDVYNAWREEKADGTYKYHRKKWCK